MNKELLLFMKWAAERLYHHSQNDDYVGRDALRAIVIGAAVQSGLTQKELDQMVYDIAAIAVKRIGQENLYASRN